jgi:hypothetical protein
LLRRLLLSPPSFQFPHDPAFDIHFSEFNRDLSDAAGNDRVVCSRTTARTIPVQEGRPAAAYQRRIDLLLFFLALFFDIIFYVIDLVVIV